MENPQKHPANLSRSPDVRVPVSLDDAVDVLARYLLRGDRASQTTAVHPLAVENAHRILTVVGWPELRERVDAALRPATLEDRVEDGARALWQQSGDSREWDDLDDEARHDWRVDAETVLAGARIPGLLERCDRAERELKRCIPVVWAITEDERRPQTDRDGVVRVHAVARAAPTVDDVTIVFGGKSVDA